MNGLDHLINFAGGAGGVFRQLAHFVGHHGKAAPGLARAAASMAAFSANRLVWSAILRMVSAALRISSELACRAEILLDEASTVPCSSAICSEALCASSMPLTERSCDSLARRCTFGVVRNVGDADGDFFHGGGHRHHRFALLAGALRHLLQVSVRCCEADELLRGGVDFANHAFQVALRMAAMAASSDCVSPICTFTG